MKHYLKQKIENVKLSYLLNLKLNTLAKQIRKHIFQFKQNKPSILQFTRNKILKLFDPKF